jgi:hypothetical protein
LVQVISRIGVARFAERLACRRALFHRHFIMFFLLMLPKVKNCKLIR